MNEVRRNQIVKPSRVLGLSAIVLILLIVYTAHLFRMQVLDGYIYVNRARLTASRSEPIFAQRGQIYDRDYDIPIALNESSFAVTLTPGEVPDGEEQRVLTELAELLDRDPALLIERYRQERGGAFQAVEVIRGLRLNELNLIAERAPFLPGVRWYSRPRRVYPFGELMAHVVGYVGDITPEELQVLFNEGYTGTSILGKSGIERQYDEILRGNDGYRVRTVDASGRSVGTEGEIIAPEAGNNLVLTIDRRLQQLAQDALGPRIGSVVVIRPGSGEVLAMVGYPRYDPNQIVRPGGDEEFRQLALDPRSPFLNRPIQSVAAPASTFKILMTTAILEEDAFPPEEQIICTGQFSYGGRIFNDWLEYGHGPVDLRDALAQSCNVYFWTMGSSYLNIDQIIDYASRLGLGRPTGIDLPGENAGLVPSPAWKEQTYNARWVGGDTVNMSIGEGFLQVTPIQMAMMVSTIVNDGKTMRPFVLREVRDAITGNTIQRTVPEIVRESQISRSTLREVRADMRGVITEGTANVVITTDAVEAAGKTGTGQVGGSETNWTSWFVAYAPYGENVPVEDKIVLVVMVDAMNDWEWWAPKAANIILHGYFKNMDFDEAVADLRRGPRPIWYM